jgi:DNA-binding transcriptional MerR regulator
VAERLHLTIGEVLSRLREEFPDVSISKIRFLESQGLVTPERTPSGYRKFYEPDVERLRWILRQQREHFLPLKVIRGRLTGEPEETAEEEVDVDDEVTLDLRPLSGDLLFDPDPSEPAPAGPTPTEPTLSDPLVTPPVRDGTRSDAVTSAVVSSESALSEPTSASSDVAVLTSTRADPDVAPDGPVAPAGPVPEADPKAKAPRAGAAQPDAYSVTELAEAANCTPQLIRDLEQFGILVAGASVGGKVYFEPDAVAVARVSARFAELGVEPRHLRTWRNAAAREASLFEQLVMPLLRQRNPHSRRDAAERLDELTTLGGELRAGLLAEALRSVK